MTGPVEAQQEIERLVALIRREQQHRMRLAVYSLWRVGDGVRRLKRVVKPGTWSRSLETCAERLAVHASSLVDAGRAAEAFTGPHRRELCARFADAGAELTPSHVIELARAPRRKRSLGVDALLQKPLTVRELRRVLRGGAL